MVNDFWFKKLPAMVFILFFSQLLAKEEESVQKMWSILICTLPERKESFERLYSHLQQQIDELELQEKVEVLYFLDNREHSIGFKRNALIEQSKGKYVCFVDDDDAVSNDYVKNIYEKLLKDPDCVGITCIVTYNGKGTEQLVQSNKYNNWFHMHGSAYTPPTHLNPIRRSIAIRFKFREINHGEDTYLAREMLGMGVLKKEEMVQEPCYFYLRTNAGTTGHMIPGHLR